MHRQKCFLCFCISWGSERAGMLLNQYFHLLYLWVEYIYHHDQRLSSYCWWFLTEVSLSNQWSSSSLVFFKVVNSLILLQLECWYSWQLFCWYLRRRIQLYNPEWDEFYQLEQIIHLKTEHHMQKVRFHPYRHKLYKGFCFLSKLRPFIKPFAFPIHKCWLWLHSRQYI